MFAREPGVESRVRRAAAGGVQAERLRMYPRQPAWDARPGLPLPKPSFAQKRTETGGRALLGGGCFGNNRAAG